MVRVAYGIEKDELCYEKEAVACSGRKRRWSKQLFALETPLFAQGKLLSG